MAWHPNPYVIKRLIIQKAPPPVTYKSNMILKIRTNFIHTNCQIKRTVCWLVYRILWRVSQCFSVCHLSCLASAVRQLYLKWKGWRVHNFPLTLHILCKVKPSIVPSRGNTRQLGYHSHRLNYKVSWARSASRSVKCRLINAWQRAQAHTQATAIGK